MRRGVHQPVGRVDPETVHVHKTRVLRSGDRRHRQRALRGVLRRTAARPGQHNQGERRDGRPQPAVQASSGTGHGRAP